MLNLPTYQYKYRYLSSSDKLTQSSAPSCRATVACATARTRMSTKVRRSSTLYYTTDLRIPHVSCIRSSLIYATQVMTTTITTTTRILLPLRVSTQQTFYVPVFLQFWSRSSCCNGYLLKHMCRNYPSILIRYRRRRLYLSSRLPQPPVVRVFGRAGARHKC